MRWCAERGRWLVGNVIQFPGPNSVSPDMQRLMHIADEIDAIILRHLTEGDIDPRDLAGLLAHRLGSFMRHLEQKSLLWDVCEKVLKTQAAID